jgi:hypothetical protein
LPLGTASLVRRGATVRESFRHGHGLPTPVVGKKVPDPAAAGNGEQAHLPVT